MPWVSHNCAKLSHSVTCPIISLQDCPNGSHHHSTQRALPPMRGLLLVPAQFLGATVAAALVSCMFPADIASVKTTLEPGTSIAQGLFIEMFLTCNLIITVLMLAAEKSKATFIAPVGIGLAFFVSELAGELDFHCLDLLRHSCSPSMSLLMQDPLSDCSNPMSRCVLYWRLTEPGTIIWPLYRSGLIRALPLDLLARPFLGLLCLGRLLPICQIFQLRRGESGTRFCGRRVQGMTQALIPINGRRTCMESYGLTTARKLFA